MNDSKKLIIVRIVVVSVIIMFIIIFVILMIKIDIVGHLFGNKHYIRVSTNSNINIDINKYNETKESAEYKTDLNSKIESKTNKINEEEQNDGLSIFKFIERIKNYKNKSINKNIDNNNDINKEELRRDVKLHLERIQQIYDKGYYDKNAWILIDEDNDTYGYNYYFDEKGKLIFDTLSPDYRIVDSYGREVNDELEPILYKIKNNNYEISTTSNVNNIIESKSDVIISENVIFNNKDNIYDNKLNRQVTDYIYKSLRFRKTTNATIYDNVKWKSVSAISNDGGYVIFNNPNNNFNKIIGKMAGKNAAKSDDEIYFTLYVYDADMYEMYNGYEYLIEPLFEISRYTGSESVDINFSFYRSIKRLRFHIETNHEDKVVCYLKNLRYGFNKLKYKEELEEAKNSEEYISYLKKLGIYQSDEELLLELKELEENSVSDYLEYDDFNDIDLYNDIDLTDYEKDKDKEQRALDRRTGPAFDEYLRKLKDYLEIENGPGSN